MPAAIDSLEYENRPIKMVATRKVPRVETPGVIVEEVNERAEFTAPYWVGRLLVEAGFVKLGETGLTPDEWTQTHFKERFNPGGPPAALPKDFYARAYTSLDLAAKDAMGEASKQETLNRLRARYREILESRVGKVTRLASTETSPQAGILQPEEDALYRELVEEIVAWRRDARGLVR